MLGVLLASPVLATGFSTDDYHSFEGALDRPFELLRRAILTPERIRAAQATGDFPWWASLNHQTPRQMRPLGAFFLWLDLRFWPGRPLPAHAHSLVMYFAMVLAAAYAYRRILSASLLTAGLAAVMFAIDDGHGITIGFIHGRSRLIAVTFAFLACVAYLRQRQDGWKPAWLLGPLAYALGLAAYEAGVLALAILLPHAAFLDPAPIRQRLRALSPYLLVTIGWRAIFSLTHSASSGAGMYADPLGEPVRFAAHAFAQLPIYLSSSLLFLPADPFLIFSPAQYQVGWGIAVLSVAVYLWLIRDVLRRDALARFFLGVTFLAAAPACAAFISDRLLLVAQFGGCGLAARVLVVASESDSMKWRRSIAVALIACHLVLAALLLPFRVATMDHVFGRRQRDLFAWLRALDHDPEATLVVLNVPEMQVGLTFGLGRQRGDFRARGNVLLGVTDMPVTVTRIDERTLSVESDGYLTDRMSVFVRDPGERMAVGDSVPVLDNIIEVAAVSEDGRPTRVLLRGHQSLSSEAYTFVTWDGTGWRRVTPPDPGRNVEYPATALGALLLGIPTSGSADPT